MADKKYNSKVVLGSGEVLIDLTGDSVAADKLVKGVTAHDKTGAPIVGTNTNDVDTSEATATAAEILAGKTAGVNGQIITGTMPNNGGSVLDITDADTPVTIPQGYQDGSGKAQIAESERSKIIPENIRQGVTILGKTGTMSGSEGVKPQAKNVTPTFSAQEILPDEGYNCLSQVNVAAIPVTYTDNAAGGQTVTIG